MRMFFALLTIRLSRMETFFTTGVTPGWPTEMASSFTFSMVRCWMR